MKDWQRIANVDKEIIASHTYTKIFILADDPYFGEEV